MTTVLDTVPEKLALEEFTSSLSSAGHLPPVKTQLVVPAPGLYGTKTSSRRFGIAETIDALLEVGSIWAQRYPGSPIGVGDISQKGGGQIPDHKSHKKGIDVDLRLQRIDDQLQPVRYQDASYSRERTQEMIDLLYANSTLAVQTIFFNDPGAQGVRKWSKHDNHLHVRFFLPYTSIATPPNLEPGDRRPAVREMQRLLNRWLGNTGSPLLNTDGVFGVNTEGAVRRFQASEGIAETGVVEADTWIALKK